MSLLRLRVLVPMLWLSLLLALSAMSAVQAQEAPEPQADAAPATATADAPATVVHGQGVLEKAILQNDNELWLTGWVASSRPHAFISSAKVWLGDELVYQGRLGYLRQRPDVAEATSQPLWLASGFHIQIALPRSLPAGPAPVRMEAMTGDGQTIALLSQPEAAQVTLPAHAPVPDWRFQILLALAVLLPAGSFALGVLRPAPTNLPAWRWSDSRRFGFMLVLSFALLVLGGWSGTSLGALLDRAAPVVQHDMAPWLGEAQPVRGDEWQVITPMAIAQTQHHPALPARNSHYGLSGHDMGVVGMTGVPVASGAALAKPATWGFFAFELRHALAWYWWLPFFAGFGALWLLLRCWFGLDWRLAALLSVSVVASPYSVSFSGWPAYALFFPVLGLLMLEQLGRTTRWSVALAAGAVAGWAAAGFMLVLYPGWQVALAYLLLPLGLVRGWQCRHSLHAGWRQLGGLLLAVVTLLALATSWWLDAGEAVERIRHTVYPGQRMLETGGYIDPWHLSKGLTNAITLFRSSEWMIPSDAGSFIFLLLPLAAAVGLRWWQRRAVDGMAVVLWLYLVFALAYMFVGIPAWVSQHLFWGMVPAYRLDIALGLAQTLLLAWLAGQTRTGATATPPLAALSGRRWLLAALVAGASVWLAVRDFSLMPAPVQHWLTPALVLWMCLLLAVLAAALLLGQYRHAIALYTAVTLGMALPFNPLGQAPSQLEPVPALAKHLLPHAPEADTPPVRVAVIAEQAWANALTAAGVAVLNGTFYEPPADFWRRIDPAGTQAHIHNRYQHLILQLESLPDTTPGWRVGSPHLDGVVLSLDPQRFDFSLLGVQALLVENGRATWLHGHPQLALLESQADWQLYQIGPSIP